MMEFGKAVDGDGGSERGEDSAMAGKGKPDLNFPLRALKSLDFSSPIGSISLNGPSESERIWDQTKNTARKETKLI
jgi:hypothetical protein